MQGFYRYLGPWCYLLWKWASNAHLDGYICSEKITLAKNVMSSNVSPKISKYSPIISYPVQGLSRYPGAFPLPRGVPTFETTQGVYQFFQCYLAVKKGSNVACPPWASKGKAFFIIKEVSKMIYSCTRTYIISGISFPSYSFLLLYSRNV